MAGLSVEVTALFRECVPMLNDWKENDVDEMKSTSDLRKIAVKRGQKPWGNYQK